jgi:hypothetical protein
VRLGVSEGKNVAVFIPVGVVVGGAGGIGRQALLTSAVKLINKRDLNIFY